MRCRQQARKRGAVRVGMGVPTVIGGAEAALLPAGG
jgi:hypothetical protein